MSDTEAAECGRSSPVHNGGGRHEKSLGLLTSKFVDLLQGAEGGVLDLKKVCPEARVACKPFRVRESLSKLERELLKVRESLSKLKRKPLKSLLKLERKRERALLYTSTQAADMLDVKQKRRIYDITNVLEGIGLIEKETKNTIKWK